MTIKVASLAGVIFSILPAYAAVLDFSGNICSSSPDGGGALIACGQYMAINQSYGDTVDVNITFLDMRQVGNSLSWWDTDYNELQNVAYADLSHARIEIAALNSGLVTLNAFNLGAWPNAVHSTNLVIYELVTGAVLADYGVQTIGVGNVSSYFAPGVSSPYGIAIEWRDDAYNVGIDNIDFTFTSMEEIPEPATWGLFASGFLALYGISRLRRR